MAAASCNDIIEERAPVVMVNPRVDSASTAAVATRELSVLDVGQDCYAMLLLYYEARAGASTTGDGVDDLAAPARRLQGALQELLVHYPCAAGVLVHNEADSSRLEVRYRAIQNGKDGLHVANGFSDTSCCYSFGVPFHVARAAVALSDLGDLWLAPPSVTEALHAPAPLPDKLASRTGRFVMAFQVTLFKCGGFSIGFTCNHVYVDGYGVGQLIQNLCSIARGAGLTSQPQLTQSRTAVFKPRCPPLPSPPPPFLDTDERTCAPTNRLETSECLKFSLEEVEALRRHVSERCQSRRCSRNTSLLALLWRAHARVCLEVRKLPRSHVLVLVVPMDLRRRQVPGVGENYVGNAVCQLSVTATLQEICDSELSDLVNRIQNIMVGLDIVETMQSMVDFLELQRRDGRPFLIKGFNVPSYVQFPFYDTDCGWGNPVYVGLPSRLPLDMCFVLDNPAARAWNVMVVLSSVAERACFQDHIMKFLDTAVTY